MKKARYESLNGLRTIACIGIVLMHIRSNIYYKLGNDIVNNIIQGFTDFVYLFMILSAFGMCCGYYNKVKNNEMDLEVFYQRRFQKVLPFFALLLIINVIYEHTSSSLIEAFSEFTLMFGFIQKDIKVLGVAWFLGIIFIFYFIFPYFVYLFSNKKRAWSTTLIAIAMNLVGAFYFHIDRTNFFYSFLYFCVGGLIYLYKDDLIKLVSKHRIITILLVFLSIFMYYGLGNLKTILFIRVIPLCVLLIAYAITFNSKMLNNNFTQIIGGGGLVWIFI